MEYRRYGSTEYPIIFKLVKNSSVGNLEPVTGVTFTSMQVRISKDGSAVWASVSSRCSEFGHGWYKYQPTASDVSAKQIAIDIHSTAYVWDSDSIILQTGGSTKAALNADST